MLKGKEVKINTKQTSKWRDTLPEDPSSVLSVSVSQ